MLFMCTNQFIRNKIEKNSFINWISCCCCSAEFLPDLRKSNIAREKRTIKNYYNNVGPIVCTHDCALIDRNARYVGQHNSFDNWFDIKIDILRKIHEILYANAKLCQQYEPNQTKPNRNDNFVLLKQTLEQCCVFRDIRNNFKFILVIDCRVRTNINTLFIYLMCQTNVNFPNRVCLTVGYDDTLSSLIHLFERIFPLPCTLDTVHWTLQSHSVRFVRSRLYVIMISCSPNANIQFIHLSIDTIHTHAHTCYIQLSNGFHSQR